MTRGRLTVVLAMVLSFGLDSPRPAFAGPGEQKTTPKKNRKHSRPRDKGFSRYSLFAADAETFRVIETQDMVEVARQMYKLDAASTAAVEAVVRGIQDARWADGKGIQAYRELLTARAALCNKLVKGEELEAGVPGVYRQLLKNNEFSLIQKEIRNFERRHPHRFADYTNELESVLDRDTVQKAHQNWHRRGKLVSRNIRSRSLLSGLMVGPGGKRAKGRDTKKQESKPQGRQKTKPRPRPEASPREPNKPGREEEKKGASRARSSAKTKSTAPKKSPRKTSTRKDKKVVKPKRDRRQQPKTQRRARPLNEWERYVRDFIQRHDLTDAQRNSALSILRDLTSRADQIERSSQLRLVEAKNIADKKVRKQRIAALTRPLDDLFHQLQRRLDGLLTASQLSKAAPKKK